MQVVVVCGVGWGMCRVVLAFLGVGGPVECSLLCQLCRELFKVVVESLFVRASGSAEVLSEGGIGEEGSLQ